MHYPLAPLAPNRLFMEKRNTPTVFYVLTLSAIYCRHALASTGGPTEPSYVAGPSGRGTIELLTTCVITLALCVWTAIHLNVPSHDERGRWKRFQKKFQWAIFALIAPELVVWRAFAQRQTARKLRDTCNKIIAERKKVDVENDESPRVIDLESATKPHDVTVDTRDVARQESPRRGIWKRLTDSMSMILGLGSVKLSENEKWSLSLAFFAVMGGFEVPDLKDWKLVAELENNSTTLTPQGVQFLFELGVLRSVEDLKRTVKDKSKADALVKGIVCIQALWMLVQTIVRKAYGLPITLLELNTIAHVGCAVLLYMLWWHKPQDIKEPEVIAIEEPLAFYLRGPICLYINGGLKLFDVGGPDDSVSAVNEKRKAKSESTHLFLNQDSHPDDILPAAQSTSDIVVTEISTAQVRVVNTERGRQIERLSPGERLEGTHFSATDEGHRLGPHEEEMLQLLSELWNGPRKYAEIMFPQSNDSIRWIRRRWYKYLTKRASNLAVAGDLGDEKHDEQMYGFHTFSDSLLTLTIMSLLYGGVHLSSWNGHFPSVIEEMMWRIAGCVVGIGGIILYALLRLCENLCPYDYDEKLYALWHDWKIRKVLIYQSFTLVGLTLRIWVVLYCVARVYLITEAFISVRSLPLGAYSTVDWVDVLPHV